MEICLEEFNFKWLSKGIILKSCFDVYYFLYPLCEYYILGPQVFNAKTFEYQSVENYCLSWGAFIVLYVLATLYVHGEFKKLRISQYIIGLLGVAYILPSLALFARGTLDVDYFYFFCKYWLVFFAIILFYDVFFCEIIHKINKWKIKYWINNNFISNYKWIYIILFFCFCMVIYIMVQYNITIMGLDVTNSDSIYDKRRMFISLQTPMYVNYFLANVGMVNIFCMLLFLHMKKYIFAGVSVGLCYLLYCIAGNKMILFSHIIIVLCYSMFKYFDYKFFFHGIICIVYFVLIGVMLHIRGSELLNSFILDRYMTIPAWYSFFYFDFFSQHEPIMIITKSLYPELPNMIGSIYLGRVTEAANNGLLGDAVAQWGMVGWILQPILLASCLMLFDYVTHRSSQFIIFSMSVILLTSIMNSFLSTNIFSAGYFVTYILFMLFGKHLSDEDINT